jgi:hypothetical protein
MQYLVCSKHEALKWVEETFNIKNDFKPMENPIKDKWESFNSLSSSQIEYLKARAIDYNLLKDVVKDFR